MRINVFILITVIGFGLETCTGRPRGQNLSPRQQEVLDAMLENWGDGAAGGWVPSPEAHAAFQDFERRQADAMGRLGEAKFILLHMNPGAGLGNRLVAVVSGFLLAQVRELQ